MKKLLAFLFALALILSFSSCGAGRAEIEDYEWKMRSVARSENGELIVDALSEEDTAYPEAKIVDMTLTANDGKITLTDITNNKTYEGRYSIERKTPDGINYKVTIDGKDGYATVAMTTYADGTEEPTLPINLGNYSIYFYAN